MDKIISSIILLVYLGVVSYTDIKYKKIYNWTTVSFFLTAIAVNTLFYGFKGLNASLGGLVLGFVILYIPFTGKWIGGGDVKMLAAAGALLGARLIAYSVLAGLILAGVFALINLMLKKRLIYFFKQLYYSIYCWLKFRCIVLMEISGTMPLGVFLSIGIAGVWVYFKFFA